MAEVIECPYCRRKLSMRALSFGQMVKCPACNEQFSTQAIVESLTQSHPPHREHPSAQYKGIRPYPDAPSDGEIQTLERYRIYRRRALVAFALGYLSYFYAFAVWASVFQTPFEVRGYEGASLVAVVGLILGAVTLLKRRSILREKEPWRIERRISAWLQMGRIGAYLAILTAGFLLVMDCLGHLGKR